jgi:hypothetical protein
MNNNTSSRLNPLKTEFPLHNIYKSSPYLTGNILHLRYKAQLVNAVWGKSRYLFENHMEQMNTLCGQNAEF